MRTRTTARLASKRTLRLGQTAVPGGEDASGHSYAIKRLCRGPIPSSSRSRCQRLGEPFDEHDWYFEWKNDGFRQLAFIDNNSRKLISRNGTSSRASATSLRSCRAM